MRAFLVVVARGLPTLGPQRRVRGRAWQGF
jgi:hypothetical protein